MTNDILSAEHRQMLEEGSGIEPAVIAARGYRTVTAKKELFPLGFSDAQARTPALLIPIWAPTGEARLYQLRPDNPRMRKGKAIKYETPQGARMGIDVHPSIRHQLGDPSLELWITEGIKKADALVSRGCCAVALLGVWNWRGTNEKGGKVALADWEYVALNGRVVYVVFDGDVMTKRGVRQALVRLKAFLEGRGARAIIIYLPAGPERQKVGVDDYLIAGHTIEDLLSLATAEIITPTDSSAVTASNVNGDGHRSAATILVEIAARADLFRDQRGDAYAVMMVEGHHETWPVRSTTFRRWLAHQFYLFRGKTPGGAAITDAITVIEGQSHFEGEARVVWTRIAEGTDGAIYIDLGTPVWDAVKVTSEGWEVVESPPVQFRRGPGFGQLPYPVSGGSLGEVRSLMNLNNESDFRRAVGWLLAALRPRGPYPVLAFIAEQGAGKSVAASLLRSLVDPSVVPLRGTPREERDLVIAARWNHVIALDNVSHVPQWASDALCRLATGAGWATRRLYTDAEEELFLESRPIIMTGIEEFVTSGDLLDRTILVGLPTIRAEEQRQEAELLRVFEKVWPRVFGVLLHAVSAALRNLPNVALPNLPRMADFAAWVIAAEEVLPWPPGGFMESYVDGIMAGHDVIIEGSIIAEPLKELARRCGVKGWLGTASDLLKNLGGLVGDEAQRRSGWPRNPRALAGTLRRLAPTLRAVGADVTFTREQRAQRRRLIAIRLEGAQISVHTVHTVQSTPVAVDAKRSGVDGHPARKDVDRPSPGGDFELEVDEVDGVDANNANIIWEEVVP